MGRPKDGKNIMRTPKEKEDIVLEYLDGRISTRAIAAKYGTTQGVFNKWLKRYRENGIKGLEYADLTKAFCFSKAMYYGDKCCNGVGYKKSTQNFKLHQFTIISNICRDIKTD